MHAADCTMAFSARQDHLEVGLGRNHAFACWLPETRPSRSRLEFVLRRPERRIAPLAVKESLAVFVIGARGAPVSPRGPNKEHRERVVASELAPCSYASVYPSP